MKRLVYMLLAIGSVQFGCSETMDDRSSKDVQQHDASYDMDSSDTPDAGDASPSPDDASNAHDAGMSGCPRGTYFNGDFCNTLAGCDGLALTREELGCVFFPDTSGRLTTAECESDEDCDDSPHGPNCILRVCHEAEPCTTDDDCDDGLVCINRAACMPPRSECEDDEDCEDPAVCFDVEQLCI